MECPRLDTKLMTIKETQQDIQNQLHQNSQWQAEMGERITSIQQHQEQQNENWHYLFQGLNIDPPFWSTNHSNTQLGGGAPIYRR